MRRILIIFFFLLTSKLLMAEHITGGEMYYTYVGPGATAGSNRYLVTLKLFRNCGTVGAPLDANAAIGVFDRSTNAQVMVARAPLAPNPEELNLRDPGKCITNAPTVCYQVGFYSITIDLPASAGGYTLAYQRCCRINGIANLVGSGNIGATYTAEIPGNGVDPTYPVNNSAKFVGTDTVIVCGGYPFTYSFAANDPDPNDKLVYSFCGAYPGGSGGPGGAAIPDPPAPPPYNFVGYSFPFNSGQPLGPTVSIDPSTGLITGTSPAEGIYVVTVCVQEIRDGIVIATQRKDIQIKAGGCSLAKPSLNPNYITCDGLSFDFTHPDNPLINTYYWEFGDPTTGPDNVATVQNPTHIFSQPNTYNIKLVANRGQDCSDSATAVVKVYPGFFPDFSSLGVCITNPVQFQDNTVATYGTVNFWSWSLGDALSTTDTSSVKNPSWTYGNVGPKTVTLIVGSDLGCRDTITKVVDIISQPLITMGFRDTLICSADDVQLQASGTGSFTWTPGTNITQANTGTPTVDPPATTTYYVTLNEQGCINRDSVRVRVVDFVSLTALGDPTTICLTDPVKLNIVSDALQYQWAPAATLDDPTLKNPTATPTTTTTYSVRANIGTCFATEDITIIGVPYPIANAGPDTTICFNTPAFLNASHNGSTFTWSPTGSLSNPGILNPIASPATTTSYIFRSFANLGCDKPGTDTVKVTLLPRIRPYAGNDTLVVVGQSVQLNAEGGVSYLWTPSTGLNNAAIANPVGVYGGENDSIRYTVQVFNQVGCSDSAFVTVVVFKTNPYVFVPTGFSPNGDGTNDLLRPTAVGVERINYFRVFNRWGQVVFSTTVNGAGWDGRINGIPQGSNVYVWMVSARDYTGREIFLKGTTTLVR